MSTNLELEPVRDGVFQLRGDTLLSRDGLQTLLDDRALTQVQMRAADGAVSPGLLKQLDETLLAARPNVAVRLYDITSLAGIETLTHARALDLSESYPGGIEDLSPLAMLGALTSLAITCTRIGDLAPLARLSNLDTLSVAATRPSRAPLAPLQALDLKDVTLDRLSLRDLPQWRSLASLSLANVAFDPSSIERIVRHPSLARLAIYGTHKSTRSLDWIGRLPALRALRIKNCLVSSLDFVCELAALATLDLSYLAQVTRLPSLASLTSLRSLEIFGLKNLANVDGIFASPSLERLHINQTKHLVPEDFRRLGALPKLRAVTIGFGNQKRNEAFDAIARELGLVSFFAI